MSVRIIHGDCRNVLRLLRDESVHCVVTSPPYWGLRDYNVAGQIGLESDFGTYIATMVELFREIRRVLRPDGTVWLNLGDSYAGSGRGGNPTEETSTLEGAQDSQKASIVKRTRGSLLPAGYHEAARQAGAIGREWEPEPFGLKQKDLCGIPWRVALALQSDGWWLRQDIIWSKPNPMPESVTDRCTKAHEYLFLLSRSERYYFDADAIAEGLAPSSVERLMQPNIANQAGSDRVPGKTNGAMKAVGRIRGVPPRHAQYESSDQSGLDEVARGGKRNKRSVWTVATQPFKEAHFATFPPALIEPCILAGCPEGGTVLDPFGGAGTTGLVADRLKRNAILIELNPDYVEMSRARLHRDAPLFVGMAHEIAGVAAA